MPNKTAIICFIICLWASCIFNGNAQPPPPAGTVKMLPPNRMPKFKSVTAATMDSINNVSASAEEIAAYLKDRPAFGDTTGKTTEIMTIIKNTKRGVLYGFYDDYASGLIKATENYRVRHQVDLVKIIKHTRKMHLMKEGKIIRSFNIALGPNPVGQKEREGDGKTPEGKYTLDWQRHETVNFFSFHISYPNQADLERAAKKGLAPGSNIMIHGTSGPKTKKDWTNGCIGISNKDMTLFKKMVFQDTQVEIVP